MTQTFFAVAVNFNSYYNREPRIKYWRLPWNVLLGEAGLRLHALVVAKKMNKNDFVEWLSLCYRFMQCNRLYHPIFTLHASPLLSTGEVHSG